MPISGLVITLSDTPELAEIALTMLRRDRRIELGERRGPCQPVVVDTNDSDEDSQLWEQLQKQEGIRWVDVAFVHFDEQSHNCDGGMGSARLTTSGSQDSQASAMNSEWDTTSRD